jgi:hypothetical protein
MGARFIISFLILTGFAPLSASRAENELILEAAAGIASENKPFTSDWRGSLGSGGLLMREFAFKMTYNYSYALGFSSTLGYISDWEKPRYVFYFDRPDLWERIEIRRRILYFRPDIQLSFGQIGLDLGILIYRENVDSLKAITEFSVFEQAHGILPVFGIKLGEPKGFIYVNFANSFPLVSGGGLIEMGVAGRCHKAYEQKLFFAMSGYQDMAIGYRGEFRIYKKTAISPGFSLGGKDRDNVYMLTLGIKSLVDM